MTVFAALIALAAAFAPASQKASSSALKAFEEELGAQAPLGFFNPLGIVADGDQAKFNRLFLAFVGFLELFVMKDSANGAKPGEFVGDFRNSALDFGWDSFDDENKLTKRAVELNQGRAAQMGMLALMVRDKLGNVEDFFPN
ncbi:hypothetical protein ACA910_009103 [Epithemia clementina (nom. ined.)]